jgi:hypothetical protein
MQKLHFSIVINAPREKVWHTMLDAPTYSEWTKVFSPGSRFEGSWDEGSEIKFLGPSEGETSDGSEGMYSRIAENRKYEFVSIEHLGIIRNGEIDTTSDEVKKWTPAFENYTFKDVEGGTEVQVDMDSADEYAEMFNGLWPKALEALKELAEK